VSEPATIEAAINGVTPKTVNPNVPVTGDEIVFDALACFEAAPRESITVNAANEIPLSQPERQSRST
jgi:hypothetical protein